jgi:hypothetical protein
MLTGPEAEFQSKRLASYRAEATALRRERDSLSLGNYFTFYNLHLQFVNYRTLPQTTNPVNDVLQLFTSRSNFGTYFFREGSNKIK